MTSTPLSFCLPPWLSGPRYYGSPAGSNALNTLRGSTPEPSALSKGGVGKFRQPPHLLNPSLPPSPKGGIGTRSWPTRSLVWTQEEAFGDRPRVRVACGMGACVIVKHSIESAQDRSHEKHLRFNGFADYPSAHRFSAHGR
jgi:hypothetical protein